MKTKLCSQQSYDTLILPRQIFLIFRDYILINVEQMGWGGVRWGWDSNPCLYYPTHPTAANLYQLQIQKHRSTQYNVHNKYYQQYWMRPTGIPVHSYCLQQRTCGPQAKFNTLFPLFPNNHPSITNYRPVNSDAKT